MAIKVERKIIIAILIGYFSVTVQSLFYDCNRALQSVTLNGE